MSEPVLPALAGLTVHDLLRVPHEVLEELRRREIVRGRNVTGDIGEYLAAAMYKVERADPGTPGYDLIDGAGLRIQVKTRAFAAKPSIIRYGDSRTADSTPCCSWPLTRLPSSRSAPGKCPPRGSRS